MATSTPAPAVTLQTILDQFRDDARNNRDLGDRFERLMQQYFRVDPLYASLFSEVWLWNQWPHKGQVGDVGIGLVAQHKATGEYWAIQCKFYLPEHTLSKADLDSFFTALGKPLLSKGLVVSTTDKWGRNALDALEQTKPVVRLGISDLEQSPIDWSQFDTRKPSTLHRTKKNDIRPHQTKALNSVITGLSGADRGKLIMACGTGKTFTALKIAETLAPRLAGKDKPAHVLFLVPSLSLLAQTLREWSAQADLPLSCLAVCSDVSIGKRRSKPSDDGPEITYYDLPFPATTNDKQLVDHYRKLTKSLTASGEDPGLVVVFSTYQSIEAVSRAQKAGLPQFDLIICDEAHRTTGVTLSGEDESAFVKVHDANFIKAKKRLYMTATPRIYGDDARSKAQEAAAELASMDDPALFGDELHRLGFGEAVQHNLLTDYKVLVLAVDEKYVSKTFQKQIADRHSELNLEDATRIVGCWNGLEKRFEAAKSDVDFQGDINPMRRAVAFSRSIKDSKKFVEQFAQIVEAYREKNPDAPLLEIEADHVDGTFDALQRGALLDWLKADSPASTCRILSNARCLSEGVDVPALDAVLFLNPRNSVIDVVQSVGRVMRRAEGKNFGYIILPIGIPADKTPEEALKDNQKYKVVWQVLQALRAHDDRFNATINQIELNKNRPDNIQVIGVGGGPDDEDDSQSPGDSAPRVREVQGTFAFPDLEVWKDAIYAKMVMKVGERGYWKAWAQDIARIAESHITRIKAILDDPKSRASQAFDTFLKGLQQNLNPAVTREEAIEMLAQHQITRPVFDALFANYVFTKHNPVSRSMQKMLDVLHEYALEKESVTLDKFYDSVRNRARGLDNAEARQRVVIELYDEFFRTAFPRMAERLGIVYTPVEVVDFIIHSVQDVLRDEFDSALGEKDVHIIDPFTGTGTFIVRLLQSGLIPPDKLPHKYQHELHANEIVLLAYYIAAINIEETFHGLVEAASRRLYSNEEGNRRDAASAVSFFDPDAGVEDLSGNLPHWRQGGKTYFVTFRLADSMPKEKLDQWIAERDAWHVANPEPHTAQQRADFALKFPDRFQDWLDAGHGSCVLDIPEVKRIVEHALRHFDGDRYRLDEFVVMPNHVHALVTPVEPHSLSEILHSWKSFTAKEILKVEAAFRRLNENKRRDVASTSVWQKESFDHVVRNPASLERFRQYIKDNPVEATSRHFLNPDEDKRRDAASTYIPFDGIVLTDTFQLYESRQMELEGTFPENSARVKRQKQSPIRVVIANPPYSVGQESTNDNNQNLRYPLLDSRIAETYAKKSCATSVRNLYDSYIRAIRWASDRIKDRGVIGFVTNGYFIDAAASDGLRASLAEEFTSLYIFNLRGNQRTSGEVSRQEGGKIFGSGSRAPIAITILVKNPAKKSPATLRYHDIGDYLDRDEKLKIIHTFASIDGIKDAGKWTTLHPNAENDWINQRDPSYSAFIAIGDKSEAAKLVVFDSYSLGTATGRDAWTFNMGEKALRGNIARFVDAYNSERKRYAAACESRSRDDHPTVEDVVDSDPKRIAWTQDLKDSVRRNSPLTVDDGEARVSLHRPFVKQWLYYGRRFNQRVYQMPRAFPTVDHSNVVICVSGNGTRAAFSTLIANEIPELSFADKSSGSQCFPLYLYEPADESRSGVSPLFSGSKRQDAASTIIDGYRRRDAITDGILKTFRQAYGRSDVSSLSSQEKRRDAASTNTITKEDIFYYVYGILHSPEYRTRFAADLKKMLPRIPLTQETADFWVFSKSGRELAKWHLNYETVPTWPVEEIHDKLDLGLDDTYKVQKMTFARPTAAQKEAGLKWDKTRIIYNSHVTISKIPLEAYEYIVNGKPAIEWIMERYQFTRDKDSGIINDPNDWCREHNQPRYIIDLVARVVRVSLETMKIVNALPALNERTV